MKFTRTIKCVLVKSKEGEKLLPNTKLSDVKKLAEATGMTYDGLEEVERVYECSLEDFMSVAKMRKSKTE